MKVDIRVKNTTNSLTFMILAEHHLELTWDNAAHWYQCTDNGCSYYENDSGVANQKTNHSIDSSSWTSNAEGHYHACSGCGFESGLQKHTYALSNDTFDFSVTECSECKFKLFEIEGSTLIAYYGEAGTVKVPNYVTVFGAHVFEGHDELVTLIYSDQLKTIEDYALAGCTSLTEFTISNRVSKIGQHVFDGTAATVKWGNSIQLKELGKLAFYGYLGKSLTIPNSVTSIGLSCFAYSGLTSFEIPDTVQYISADMFQHCTSLRSVIVGNNIVQIPQTFFDGCTSLKTVLIKGSGLFDTK